MFFCTFIEKNRDPLIRDPLCLSLLSLIKARLSLIDSYISLLSLIKAIYFRGSLSGGGPIFPYDICLDVNKVAKDIAEMWGGQRAAHKLRRKKHKSLAGEISY